MAPSSAKAKEASMVTTRPATQTPRKSAVEPVLAAISFAVRKIPEPMMPLASNRMESSRDNPRISLVGLPKTGAPSLLATKARQHESIESQKQLFAIGIGSRPIALAADALLRPFAKLPILPVGLL